MYRPRGQQILTVIGDSINATNSGTRMQIGYRDQLEIPYNGWVVHADSGNSDVGYMNTQGQFLDNVVRNPGDTFSNGLAAISPVRTRDAVWSSPAPPYMTISDCFILNYRLADMKLGNPFAGPNNVSVRLLMYEGPTQLAGFNAAGSRSSTIITSANYTRPDPVAGEIISLDREVGPGTANPGIKLRSDTVTDESTPGANTLILLGARFRAAAPADGVQIQFIAHGGWNTLDHTDPTRFTDDALAQYYAAAGIPTHALLWIGQNLTPPESADFGQGLLTVYKGNVAAIIDRHERAIADLDAPPPRWLLVSQYKTGYDEAYCLLIAKAQHELSLEHPNVSFLNLYLLAGGELFDKIKYLEDGVHPNLDGVQYLAALMNAEMLAAVNSTLDDIQDDALDFDEDEALVCRADYDGSGFVDLEDVTAFFQDFTAGDSLADIDLSGFVDTDDYDLFILLFERGC